MMEVSGRRLGGEKSARGRRPCSAHALVTRELRRINHPQLALSHIHIARARSCSHRHFRRITCKATTRSPPRATLRWPIHRHGNEEMGGMEEERGRVSQSLQLSLLLIYSSRALSFSTFCQAIVTTRLRHPWLAVAV